MEREGEGFHHHALPPSFLFLLQIPSSNPTRRPSSRSPLNKAAGGDNGGILLDNYPNPYQGRGSGGRSSSAAATTLTWSAAAAATCVRSSSAAATRVAGTGHRRVPGSTATSSGSARPQRGSGDLLRPPVHRPQGRRRAPHRPRGG